MPRIKTFEMDGAKFQIAPLTLAQAEEWIAAEPVKTDNASTLSERLLKHFRDVICPGLNNALPLGSPADQQWTPERCRAEMDQVIALRLYEEILVMSGYRIVAANAQQANGQGEAQGTSTSQPSVGS